jgi:hypothetical protein
MISTNEIFVCCLFQTHPKDQFVSGEVDGFLCVSTPATIECNAKSVLMQTLHLNHNFFVMKVVVVTNRCLSPTAG